jgi:hypothetical protein
VPLRDIASRTDACGTLRDRRLRSQLPSQPKPFVERTSDIDPPRQQLAAIRRAGSVASRGEHGEGDERYASRHSKEDRTMATRSFTANLREAVELFLETADPEEVAQRLRGEVYVTRFEAAHG